jgi:hypothetical protein
LHTTTSVCLSCVPLTLKGCKTCHITT